MKIRNFRIILIAPFLLLTPMMCMHLGDDHHTGDPYSSVSQLSSHNFIYNSNTMIKDKWFLPSQGEMEG
jgi:hypothetical protein